MFEKLFVGRFGPSYRPRVWMAICTVGLLIAKKSTLELLSPNPPTCMHKIHFGILCETFYYFFQAKMETKALKAKRPGFNDDRYNETQYYVENGTMID
jgi:hypothetical protein